MLDEKSFHLESTMMAMPSSFYLMTAKKPNYSQTPELLKFNHFQTLSDAVISSCGLGVKY
jgi:hypothetical protein